MNTYKSIRELVIDTYVSKGGLPSYETLTAIVKSNFPKSKWKESHYAWYKSQIKTGKIDISNVETSSMDDADTSDSEIDNDISESIDMSVSLERDLHNYLANRLTEIEPGLTLFDGGIEYQTDAGRIDILAKTAQGQLVVIELKAGKAKDGAIGQLLGYIGCLVSQKDLKNIRGILVASSFDDRVVFASKGLPQNKLPRRKQRGIKNQIKTDYAASGGEFNPECRLNFSNTNFALNWMRLYNLPVHSDAPRAARDRRVGCGELSHQPAVPDGQGR